MTNLHLIFLFFIQQSIAEYPPVVPLTNALTVIYCHRDDEAGTMNIRCGSNEKIRMLDAYDVVVKNKSHLPVQCLMQKHPLAIRDDHSSEADCKIHTSFSSACSGRENCTVHMQRTRLNSVNERCYDELVDYTIAFFECVSDIFIHDVCSTQAITSAWGTLKTPNFPNPYTSNDDCWCKLSTQLKHRLLLSIIVFQLIPYDQQCAGAGLYLQSSETQRSTQCTYLPQGYNLLSDGNSLYMNFYSRTSTVRGGFWISYEASYPNAEVHLHCGAREKLGVPTSPTSYPSTYNHGWSRLGSHHLSNPITTAKQMMPMHFFTTTSRSYFDRDSKVSTSTMAAGAFTYPYGRLTTFELDYGPKGWFLKYLFGSSNMTATRFLQTTTTPFPVIKWNSTWRYFRRTRLRVFTTKITTTIKPIPIRTSTLTSTSMKTSTIRRTKPSTTRIPSTIISTTTMPNIPAQQRMFFTYNPWLYHLVNNTDSFTKTRTESGSKSTTYSLGSSSTSKTTLPLPTPWYPPAGPFDWWLWKSHTTKLASAISDATQTSTTTTRIIPTTTTRSTTDLTTTMQTSTSSPKNTSTADWFHWPPVKFTSTMKETSDYDEEEYREWPDYFATTKIQPDVTTNSLLFFPPETRRKKFQQMNFFSTKMNMPLIPQLFAKPTPNFSLYPTRLSTDPQSAESQSQKIMEPSTPDVLQQIVERENKKALEENRWLNKTDITIVAVSVLFVILLVLSNLILFAVRRRRHQLQGQHLFSTPSINSRRIAPNDHFHNNRHGLPISAFNSTNNNNNDILPAVGEIVIWDDRDQGGYTIDNQGEWSKIDGRQWFGNNLLKNCSKTSFSKSFRSRFQFIRQSNKKPLPRPPQAPRTPQQAYKSPLLMDTASLSPVLEVDDYRVSDLSSEVAIQKSYSTAQALVHKEQDQSDDDYKRIGGSESNYTTVHGNTQGEYSLADHRSDRSGENDIDAGESMIISVPTMFRQYEDVGTISDAGESIYNQNYSLQSLERDQTTRFDYRNQSPMTNTIIIGHCQAEFQPLDPSLFLKKTDPSLLADHQQFYSYSRSLDFSTYDSGYFDDQATIQSNEIELNDLTRTNSRTSHQEEH